MTRSTMLVATVAMVCLLAGCPKPPTKVLTIDQVLTPYNTNAAKIPKLRANPQVQVSIQKKDSLLPFTYSFDTATLLLGKQGCAPFGPYDFVLIGKEGGREIFRLGSNVGQDVYYMWYQAGQKGELLRGRLNLAGSPGASVPIDPNQLVAALAVTQLPGDLAGLPNVSMKTYVGEQWFKPKEYAYVLTYADRQPVSNRVLPRREMFFRWSDTQPPLLYKINFLGSAGERVMTATMSDYQPVAAEGLATNDLPIVPTRISVTWDKGHLDMVLSNMSTEGAWDPAAASELSAPHDLPVTNIDEEVRGGPAK